MRSLMALVIAAPLALGGCVPGGPVVTPVPLPVIIMPPEVQQACSVLQWAVPIAMTMYNVPGIQRYIDAAQPAMASCAAGNATQAIIDVAAALQNLLMSKGVRPPVGLVLLRR